MEEETTYTAFAGERMLVSGSLRAMLLRTKQELDAGTDEPILIFQDQLGKQVDFDFSGTPEEVVERAEPSRERTGPGRPKLGVVSREVSLLPRHWDWLEQQPQGSSAAIRRLVEEAKKRAPAKEKARLARDAASKFMWAMAGNFEGFEEASRALFAGEHDRFAKLVKPWPRDIRKHLTKLVKESVRLENEGETE